MNKFWNLVIIFCIFHFATAGGCKFTNFSIQCQNLSLGRIPQTNFSDVIYFDISHNVVSYLDANDFRIYENLTEIHAGNNNISFIGPGLFFSHNYLKVLILKNNVLLEFNSSMTFKGGTVLQILNLKCNKLMQVDISSFESLHLLNLEINAIKALSLSSSNINSLRELYLGKNVLKQLTFPQNCQNLTSPMRVLDIHDNFLKDVTFLKECKFSSLIKLNLAKNDIAYLPQNTFHGLTNLVLLILDDNPLITLSDFVFSGLYYLSELHLNNLSELNHVGENVLTNLSNLICLELQNSKMLANISYETLLHFTKLQSLDFCNNNLTLIDIKAFMFLQNLKSLNISSSEWTCNHSISSLDTLLTKRVLHEINLHCLDLFGCIFSSELNGLSIQGALRSLKCSMETLQSRTTFFRPGSTAILDCDDDRGTDIVWIRSKFARREIYFDDNYEIFPSPRHYVMPNGSLVIENIDGSDVGLYECYVNHEGHGVILKLDYMILNETEFKSMLVGLVVSAMFLLISTSIISVKTCCMACSQKEKEKKTSMREVLTALETSSQSDRFLSYKSAQLERFTAFRSATLEQISAFKNAKIDQLIKYKQASVNGILHCLDKMRIHYSNQSCKVKTHCQQQFDKLRESYICQRNRFRDNRSQQVKKIRVHYHSQALRIRGCGVYQMSRLREQYRIQQQNLMKLLELLDVGKCLHVIEDECSRTESMIFDSKLDGCVLESKRNGNFDCKEDDDESDVFEFPPFLGDANEHLEKSSKPLFTSPSGLP